MKKLSIVIVNYNVRSFLEQCLRSIMRSKAVDYITDLDVYVVDNASVDDSLQMLYSDFPWVKTIANSQNLGFAKANNIAIAKAQSKYVLLLNPDTILEEDTLRLCLDFMESHPDCGGLGVRMLDANGNFLPESKRGLPSPSVALCKFLGLHKFFPESKKFAYYYMGHLPEDETNQVDILSGAFMMMPKAYLDEIGYLDESYFMYGEDIDLSYRICLGGKKNYYYPDTRIIHYKGESTKKSSLNYVRIFYKAMEIFVNRYFKDGFGGFYANILKFAIWFRASFSFLKRILAKLFKPSLDFVLSYLIFVAVSYLWAKFYFGNINYYPLAYRSFILPLYSLFIVSSLSAFGCYRKNCKPRNICLGYLVGVLFIFALFSLMGPKYHFSRFVLLSSSAIFSLISISAKYIGRLKDKKTRKFLVLGEKENQEAANKYLKERGIDLNYVFTASLPITNDRLKEFIAVYKIDEVIICSEDLSFSKAVDYMKFLGSIGIESSTFSKIGGKISGSNL